MKKRAALILSGGGHLDGSELLEAASCLISASEIKFEVQCFAAKVDFESVNHLTRKLSGEIRCAQAEAGRLARGKVEPLQQLNPSDFDALIIPGGSGFAKVMTQNQNPWSSQSLREDFLRAATSFYKEQKPILAICISPVLVSLALRGKKIILTTGEDPKTQKMIEDSGNSYETCASGDFISDRDHRVISTPAYMYDSATPAQVFSGIRGAMRETYEMS